MAKPVEVQYQNVTFMVKKSESFAVEYNIWQKDVEKLKYTVYVVEHELPYHVLGINYSDAKEAFESVFAHLIKRNKNIISIQNGISMADNYIESLRR